MTSQENRSLALPSPVPTYSPSVHFMPLCDYTALTFWVFELCYWPEVIGINIPNVVAAPKTTTFQMRVNPDVKQRVKDIYARQGLKLTGTVDIFIQQSLNMGGLPFLASPENEAYMKGKAMRHLMSEIQRGWDSAEKDGWVSEEDAYRQLGVGE